MLASPPVRNLPQESNVKKSIIALLVLLAVAVLVSPAIVGRIAEKSLDENLSWAASKSGKVTVTSEAFTRGWFSSTGRHRVELREGELLGAVQALGGPAIADELPVLIINTHLDHGLIPLASMSRERGSLAPELGSAVSTLQIELGDDEAIDLPGTIYSDISLGGDLRSSYVLEPGSRVTDDTTVTWSATKLRFDTNPKTGEAAFDGTIGPLTITNDNEKLTLGGLSFTGQQQPTQYGIAIGDITLALDGLAIDAGFGNSGGLKSLSLDASSELDDDTIDGRMTMDVALEALPKIGDMSYHVNLDIIAADAEALGGLQESLQGAGANTDPMALYAILEDDLKKLFAAGFALNFKQLNVTLPQGTVTSTMLLTFGEEDPATFAWPSLLLSTEASINLSVPAPLVDMLTQANPQLGMAIGAGYLVKQGDAYEMKAALKKGLLTINGAPIPIPLGAVR